MLHELAHTRQNVASTVGRAGLQGKPFVNHQRFVLEHFVEQGQGLLRQGMAAHHQGRQSVEAVGHVARVLELLVDAAGCDRICAVHGGHAQHAHGQSGQGAASARLGIG